MFFKNRQNAGEMLAKKLLEYKNNKNCIVVGLPRGGVVTAFEVAKALHLPLDVLCPRKIRAPHNPELAIGAVNKNGIGYLNQELIESLNLSPEYLTSEVDLRKKEVEDRLKMFRKNKPTQDFFEKTVILVDDGLATGATMLAAIAELRGVKVKKIIVAVPVSHPDTLKIVMEKVDELICLFSTTSFCAVGQFYEEFDQTDDAEVIKILENS